MFESLLRDYFDNNPQKEWSIINALRYIESKTELLSSDTINIFKDDMYSLLQSLSDKRYVHEFAKKKAKKILANYDKSFSSGDIKRFIDEIELKNEKKEFQISISRRVTSASTLKALEEHREDRIAIGDMRNAESTTSTVEFDSERKYEELAKEIMDRDENGQIVSEAAQESGDFSAQSYDQEDQETNGNKLDEIVVTKISALLFSNLSLERIWTKVMERLKRDGLRVQSIESRIIDLSNWTKVEWNRILKVSDYSQLFIKSRKKLCKDKIDENVRKLLHNGTGKMQSLSDLKLWKDKFTNLEPSEDAKITVGIIEFFCLCLRREINILTTKHRERDYVVKILSPIIGFLIEEFNIGTFELNWIEKDSRSVTRRKRKALHEMYTTLDAPTKKVDLIILLRSYQIELLPLEAGNTEGPMDDTKFREDHSKMKVMMKDFLDAFWSSLHFRKDELKEVYIMGIQVTGNKWTIHSLTYDDSVNFYFFTEMATLTLPTTLSDMEGLLPGFLENLLALRHTLIDLATMIQKIAQQKLTTPSPPSSPLHETSDTPSIKKQKTDSFSILDNLYD
ncbi:2970_t:CDS:10 [Paraglomus occultum]|uniref:2970_t:CDS:1 n=1 Tax=Paraglomus occultum TaxID=144539 RepID=A0A9N8WKQ0_9GLOM|nr:2970_t:CDS:10 [Paraglomus occultum]